MNIKPRQHGFQVGGSSGDLFRSTAPFYAKYRRPYPAPVVSHLVETFGLDGCGRLLDAGCGTGQVFQVLAGYFEEVIALDADEEMVHYARKAATEHRLDHVTVLLKRAEEIGEHLGEFRMAIFGASFHWMDRRLVGELVYDRLEPGGHIVVLSPNDIQSGTSDWEAEIRTLLAEWLGTERRAGGGIYHAGERHAEALRRTRFKKATEMDIPIVEEWSLDEIVGYLFSTSYASKAVLGEKAEDFEHTVRTRLLNLYPDGRFQKIAEYTAISASRAIDTHTL